MKKILFFLASACTSLNMHQSSTFSLTNFTKHPYFQEFTDGIAAGAIAGISIDFLRQYIFPDITHLQLYNKYGICRDSLTGQAKVAAALIASTALDDQNVQIDFRKISAKTVGILVGICTGSYITRTR